MTPGTGIPRLSSTPVARAFGAVLSGAFAVGRRLRHPRPIHPRGAVLSGHVRWIPDAEPSGIAWIDRTPDGPVPVVARVSRSIGLPAPLPDIVGLALRVEADGEPADIELASTGWTVPARFALRAHRRVERARFGTLFPYRGTRGPVLVGARTRRGRPAATDPRELRAADERTWSLTLGHATALGAWHPFAVVDLRLDDDQDDTGLRFDAVRHPLPGSHAYAWVRAARQPSYARVQPAHPEVRMPR
ncbi:hypothetical protein SAMN04487788_1898 [Microbacterium testaceum StLB037]|jgi:hypothetical protein|uniref:Phosphodiesterase n=1 Tax=Microbacterium testaceum (strain StLB037) TaxID=979556 RepID=A0A1H0PP98_MICTS|nr:hypothetical protein [Microbacterium testaceum]SDP06475.1 hypothetical protein SAMN04487788_1898 [Microbacterium testaceum StLB037]